MYIINIYLSTHSLGDRYFTLYLSTYGIPICVCIIVESKYLVGYWLELVGWLAS